MYYLHSGSKKNDFEAVFLGESLTFLLRAKNLLPYQLQCRIIFDSLHLPEGSKKKPLSHTYTSFIFNQNGSL